MSKTRVLVIDADPVIRSGICNFLLAHGQTVAEAATGPDAQAKLQRFSPDVTILDFSFPNGDALQLLQSMKSSDPGTPVLALVSQGAPEIAIRAMQDGAEQFLTKPVDLPLLYTVLLRTITNRPRRHQALLPLSGKTPEAIDPFLGTSTAIRRLRDLAVRVAGSESPVLLQGETGSGKGVLATWIHGNSPRADEPFLDLNCAGLSRELLESELFGHEKGAFTSAVSAKQGLFEIADGGTVFLDEIGDIDIQVQPKLLKVLEDRTFRRLGDVRDRSVDIRLISATHRELVELVRQREFRSDLYFRMNIVPIRVPPLRERPADIPVLVEYFLSRLSLNLGRAEMMIDKSGMDALQQYSWPGNIRELRNVLERAVLLAQNDCLTRRSLQFQTGSLNAPPATQAPTGTLREVEKSYIHSALQDESGCVERTARRLGIGRSSLYAKMRRHGIPGGTGRPQLT